MATVIGVDPGLTGAVAVMSAARRIVDVATASRPRPKAPAQDCTVEPALSAQTGKAPRPL
jgi:hypothetical protein